MALFIYDPADRWRFTHANELCRPSARFQPSTFARGAASTREVSGGQALARRRIRCSAGERRALGWSKLAPCSFGDAFPDILRCELAFDTFVRMLKLETFE